MDEALTGAERHASTSLAVAAADALVAQAHLSLGRMWACETMPAFQEALTEFLGFLRDMGGLISRLGRFTGDSTEVAALARHPVGVVLAGTKPAKIYSHRLARGSAPPFKSEDGPPKRVAGDDFYFDHLGTQPAVAACFEYIERVSELVDRSRRTLSILP